MTKGILGKKIGMTQIFSETGALVPVTVIEAGPCYVLQIKTREKDGYSAIQLGFEKRFIKELKAEGEFKVGQRIEVDFEEGGFVDITGTSKGKGFQGGVKRWGWSGGKASHGSMHHRTVGSLSASSFPSRIFKGHHMPGRMGGDRRTVQNLEVLKVDKKNNLILVKGAVPGHNNGLVFIKESKKKKGISRQQTVITEDKGVREAKSEVKKQEAKKPEAKKTEAKKPEAKKEGKK